MKPVASLDPSNGKVVRSKVLRETPCAKQGYTSRKVAKAAAAASSRCSGEEIEAYRCKRGCHLFHIGHVVPRILRQAS